jgi:hypothetical protein
VNLYADQLSIFLSSTPGNYNPGDLGRTSPETYRSRSQIELLLAHKVKKTTERAPLCRLGMECRSNPLKKEETKHMELCKSSISCPSTLSEP